MQRFKIQKQIKFKEWRGIVLSYKIVVIDGSVNPFLGIYVIGVGSSAYSES
jgi:hypothetical protein